jgi:hypothetical protein
MAVDNRKCTYDSSAETEEKSVVQEFKCTMDILLNNSYICEQSPTFMIIVGRVLQVSDHPLYQCQLSTVLKVSYPYIKIGTKIFMSI